MILEPSSKYFLNCKTLLLISVSDNLGSFEIKKKEKLLKKDMCHTAHTDSQDFTGFD